MKVLIAYASATGATQKIAEHITTRLTSSPTAPKITTVLHPLCQPSTTGSSQGEPASSTDIDVGSFDAMISGSAIHNGKWLPQAEEFVVKLKNEGESAKQSAKAQSEIAPSQTHGDGTRDAKPVFAFSVGAPSAMPLGMGKRLGRSEEKRLDAELREQLGRQLKGHKLFEGVWREDTFGKGAMSGVL